MIRKEQMRKPKIGDIVYVFGFPELNDDKIYPALVLKVINKENTCRLYIWHKVTPHIKDVHFDKDKHSGYWSWPEEEKQCEYYEDGKENHACGSCDDEEKRERKERIATLLLAHMMIHKEYSPIHMDIDDQQKIIDCILTLTDVFICKLDHEVYKK